MAHPNEDLLRRGYDAFASNDVDTLLELWDEDIVWHSYGRSPFSGDFKGAQEILGMFATIPEETEEFSLEVHDVLANDEHAVVMVKTDVVREGTRSQFDAVHIYHVRDGKVTEAFIVPADQDKSAEIWD